MDTHRILIVEDEAVSALELKEFLEKQGYTACGPVNTPNKAVEAVLNSRIDLILMDINLNSFIDGIDTACRIALMKSVPIIFLTAYPCSMIEERAMKVNPAAYLEKPVNLDHLNSIIQAALEGNLTRV